MRERMTVWLRMLKKMGRLWPFSYPCSQRGSTYIEVLIAVVVLGFMTASVPPVLVYVSDAEFKRNEKEIAENVTRNQFEYVKNEEYLWANDEDLWDEVEDRYRRVRYTEVATPSSYNVQVIVEPIDPDSIDPGTGEYSMLPNGQDYGIQRVTVTVFGYRLDPDDNLKWLMKTQDYKIARDTLLDEYDIY